MSDCQKDIQYKLNTISGLIDQFLDNPEETREVLLFTENWLNTQLNKISLRKLKDVRMIKDQEDELKVWQDGMLVINSQTSIIRYSGFQNYFLAVLGVTPELKLIDFVAGSDKEVFLSAFAGAIRNKKNVRFEIRLQTSLGNSCNCRMEIDITSSSPENDRYNIYYSLHDHFNIHAFNFQSVVFDHLPEMDVFIFDNDYRYILAAGKEKERHHLSNADFLGKRMFDIFDKQTQRKIFPFYHKALNGESMEGEVRYKKDVYYLVAAPVKDHENKTVAGILVSQNVTSDKLLEESLIKSKEEAQRADKAKSIFLANLSHEIRTPLNSITGFTEQLEKTGLDVRQQKFVNLINNASEHLLYLVSEIVFLFKLGMGKVYIENIVFSMQELLNEIGDDYRKQAMKKNLDFTVEKDQNLPDVVLGDPFRLRQIIMNLLVNALKYTDEGSVKLRVKVLSEGKNKVEVLIEVSDTGIGIHEKDLPYIFDVFEQGNTRTEKIRGGAGLGLGICKKLIELFRGEIYVESKLNSGTTFFVRLPFVKSEKSKLKIKDKEYKLEDSLLAGKKILLADDDEHNLLLAEMILRSWQTDFILVKDGAEAIKMAEKEKFDLILLDIHMPNKDGVQVIKTLRSNNSALNYSTKVLALTANALKSDITRYLKTGFDDYVIKPFKEMELYNKLCNILKIGHAAQQEKITQNVSMEQTFTDDSFDVQELNSTANGDDEFFNMMIDSFITNARNLLETFQLAIQQEDWREIGEKAHKAIPSFKFFKLNFISAQLERTEDVALRENRFSELPDLVSRLDLEIKKVIQQAVAAKK